MEWKNRMMDGMEGHCGGGVGGNVNQEVNRVNTDSGAGHGLEWYGMEGHRIALAPGDFVQ